MISDDVGVTGVQVEGKDGNYKIIAKKVLLCCGGMGYSPTMLKQYDPEYADAIPFCSAGNTGDGIMLTRALDAELNGYGIISSAPGMAPHTGGESPLHG